MTPNAWHVPGESHSAHAAAAEADALKSCWFVESANWLNCEGLSPECRACQTGPAELIESFNHLMECTVANEWQHVRCHL